MNNKCIKMDDPVIYQNRNSLFQKFKISFYLSVVFFSFPVEGNNNMCSGAESSVIADIQQIACATEDLQEAVSKDNLFKKLADANFFSSDDDPRDIVRGVEVLELANRALTNKIEDFHEERIKSGKMPYTVSVTGYPHKVKEGSCPEKYKTITVGTNNMDYQSIPKNPPRRFEVRYNPKEEEFFMCENTGLSDEARVKTYCINLQSCKNRCLGADSWDCEDECKSKFDKCKTRLPPSCGSEDKNAVTMDKAEECLSLGDYQKLSKELLTGKGWFASSNPALEQNCPKECSYYTQTIQRVFQKDDEACSDNYAIVHCGPKIQSSEYNLNIREIKNLCTDFDSSGCRVY